MEHGLKDIAFYVKKHIPYTVVITSLLVRGKRPEAPVYVKRVYFHGTITRRKTETVPPGLWSSDQMQWCGETKRQAVFKMIHVRCHQLTSMSMWHLNQLVGL